MYADLKDFGRITYQGIAQLLLSKESAGGRPSPQSRAMSDRSYLSREVVHADPHRCQPGRFGDIPQATLTLVARITSNYDGTPAEAHDAIASHYGGEAARAMCDVLEANGLGSTLYRNALDKLSQARLHSEKSRGTLYLMLFVATGCLGDPSRSVRLVEDFAADKLSAGLYTTETSVGKDFGGLPATPKRTTLGLLRIQDGVAIGAIHHLSTDPQGSVIGALASGPSDVSDVDPDVSRRHLRIWREGDAWYAQGLGSTNGTTLVSGGDERKTLVVEPPRGLRKHGVTYPPVRVAFSDVLCLGATTRFLVMQIAG